jgi:hypothetical protein
VSGEPDDLLTPWDWIVVPTAGPTVRRFRDENYAVWSVLCIDGMTWDAAFTKLIDQGATDTEIWAGGWRDLLSIPVRRYLETRLGAMRHIGRIAAQVSGRMPTTGHVRRERERRIATNEPSGYDALARHFHCSATTIRRRLEATS